MTNVSTTSQNQLPATGVKGLSEFLNSDSIKSKFAEILGQKGNGFIASILSAVSSNDLLKDADRNSIYTCALMAASLDLPINQNLGMAYLIPYNVKQSDGTFKKMCQFQIGYKGFKQLAQRSGQFLRITEAIVYDGQLVEENPLTGYEFDWKKKKSETVIGYVSYFELINGFKSTLYLTIEDVKKHGAKYSKTFKNQYGIWNTEFDSMALKTVTKLNLSKNAPLSIEMQRATIADQAVIKSDGFANGETLDVDTQYVDHEEVPVVIEEVTQTKSRERVVEFIKSAKSVEELSKCLPDVDGEDHDLILQYEDKKKELSKKK